MRGLSQILKSNMTIGQEYFGMRLGQYLGSLLVKDSSLHQHFLVPSARLISWPPQTTPQPVMSSYPSTTDHAHVENSGDCTREALSMYEVCINRSHYYIASPPNKSCCARHGEGAWIRRCLDRPVICLYVDLSLCYVTSISHVVFLVF